MDVVLVFSREAKLIGQAEGRQSQQEGQKQRERRKERMTTILQSNLMYVIRGLRKPDSSKADRLDIQQESILCY